MKKILRKRLAIPLFSLLTCCAMPGQAGAGGALNYSFTTPEGKTFPLNTYKGRAVLVVNTASECGFTKQYNGLQTLWETYRDRGLVVIAVPSNDFGGQEPLSGKALKKFCTLHYNITFPVMDRTMVSGDSAHPFYRMAAEHFGYVGTPKWNFHKYLINSKGELVDWFSSITSPDSPRLRSAIEAALPASPPATIDAPQAEEADSHPDALNDDRGQVGRTHE